MADVTLTYKGSTLAEMNASGSKTLKTAGKYCEGDIGVSYVKPSGGGGSTDIEDAIITKAITSYSNPRVTKLGIYAFNQCLKLTSVNMPLVEEISAQCFAGDVNLTDVNLPVLTIMGNNAFQQCTSLTKLSFPCLTCVPMSAFRYSGNFATLILSNSTMCTLNNKNAFTDTPIAKGTGYIYVPQSLIEAYKTATNWVTYASQFRAIEDYPDICGEVTT